ncbi:hypothetical protein AB0L06_41750 [Spirillospora sp. NPDC052269]
MTVYGVRWGGPSYSRPYLGEPERFTNPSTAKDALYSRNRSDGHHSETFGSVEHESERVFLPVVATKGETFVHLIPDADLACPRRRIHCGPRDGLRVERC